MTEVETVHPVNNTGQVAPSLHFQFRRDESLILLIFSFLVLISDLSVYHLGEAQSSLNDLYI